MLSLLMVHCTLNVATAAGRNDHNIPRTLRLHRRQRGVDRIGQPQKVDLDHLTVFGRGRVLEGLWPNSVAWSRLRRQLAPNSERGEVKLAAVADLQPA